MVEDELDCGRRCLACDGCISYNYQYKVNHRKVHKCELNSQTKEAKPEDYEVKYGFQYFGSVNEQEVSISMFLILLKSIYLFILSPVYRIVNEKNIIILISYRHSK